MGIVGFDPSKRISVYQTYHLHCHFTVLATVKVFSSQSSAMTKLQNQLSAKWPQDFFVRHCCFGSFRPSANVTLEQIYGSAGWASKLVKRTCRFSALMVLNHSTQQRKWTNSIWFPGWEMDEATTGHPSHPCHFFHRTEISCRRKSQLQGLLSGCPKVKLTIINF